MNTKITTASVKVMQSYNYCHFEASMSLENSDGLETIDIDNARKDCQRLTDKAVKQYQQSKSFELKRANLRSEKSILEREVANIKAMPENTWSVTDKAKVKALADHNWDLQFDYEDDWNDQY
jgi:predicted nucleotide-binding protein